MAPARPRLSSLDTTFLELEQADHGALMHLGAALVFGPVAATDAPPAIDEVRDLVARRLPALPLYRARLLQPEAGGLERPAFVEDEPLDLAAHVRHATLPAPAGDRELRAWLADFWSHKLDRARPLWEMALVDGLPDGRWILATKTHHALVDGVGAVDIGHVLLDWEREPRGHAVEHRSLVAEPPRPLPIPGARTAWRATRAGLRLVREPLRLVSLANDGLAMAKVLWRDEVNAAPETSLNVPIGSTRRFAAVTLPLEQVQAVKRSLGGTVNDVVLAVTAGALRRLLTRRGDDVDGTLRAMIPVNVRNDEADAGRGNHISSLFVELPVDEPEPSRRYVRTRDAAQALKDSTAVTGGSAIVRAAGLLPPLLHQSVARLLFGSRLFNLTVTNVPGPQRPLYALGAELEEILPLVPLPADHALGIAVTSYNGNLTFGLNADHAAVPDLEVAERGIRESFDELQHVAGPWRKPHHNGHPVPSY